MSSEEFTERFAETANEQFSELIDGAAEKVQWARAKANEFLEYADWLEDRAESYRHLAALMLIEAQQHAGNISELVQAEFPTNLDFPGPDDEGS